MVRRQPVPPGVQVASDAPGAVVFYTGVVVNGRELGHAGVSIGNGLAVSTQGLDGAGAGIRSPYTYNGLSGLTYQGYVTDPRP